MNHSSDRRHKNQDSAETSWLSFLGWITIGIACLLLMVFVLYPRLQESLSSSSEFKPGPKVYRTKMPQEIKTAKNLYRAKISAAAQPLKQSTNTESMPSVEKKTVPSQPVVERNEQKKPMQATGLAEPTESVAKTETKPPDVKATPSQPTGVPSEKKEPKKAAELVEQADSAKKNETKPSDVKAMSSQPTDESPEQKQPSQATGLVRPIESAITNDTTASVVEAAPIQSIVIPAEPMESKQTDGIATAIDSPIKNETPPPVTKTATSPPIVATPEQIDPHQETKPHSQALEQSVSSATAVEPPEQKELPVKTDLLQAEVSLQPAKEDIIEKIEVSIIHSEDWLLSQKSSHYTIQLMGARDETLLFDFVEKYHLLEQNEIAFYKTTFKDKPWFQLLYGVYATKRDAQSAAANLPQKIRKSSPWIRRFSGVQKAIRNQAAR
jgi:septal ring-binding cell division protein DamX